MQINGLGYKTGFVLWSSEEIKLKFRLNRCIYTNLYCVQVYCVVCVRKREGEREYERIKKEGEREKHLREKKSYV